MITEVRVSKRIEVDAGEAGDSISHVHRKKGMQLA
jgi:hypothetical protein